MHTILRFLALLPLIFVLHNCANYKLNYTPDVNDWEKGKTPPAEELHHSVYLIGDAGGGNETYAPPALRELGRVLATASENSTVVFLGDNIYPNGMAPRLLALERERDETALDYQLDAVRNFPGDVYFVAGNHDWYEYGVPGVRREARYLKKNSDGQVKLLPRPGCGDPVEVELTEDVTLLLLDSQWWLTDWSGKTEINEGCEVKSKAEFAFLLREALKGNRRKEIIVAMHHPLYSNGPHGGQYTFNEHIFPLRSLNKSLYVPLPVVGSVFNFLRAKLGSRQDINNATYRDLRNLLVKEADVAGSVVFAAGHEHSIQYWEKDNHHFIVSGAGSKKSPSRTGNGALFAYGGYGYSRLDYFNNGEVWVNYYRTPAEGESELVFKHMIKDGSAAEEVPLPIIEDQFSPDQIRTTPVSETDFSRSKLGEAWWGSHYRDAYASDLKVKELNLQAEGLIPVKRGGGQQTNSLRLEDEFGREFTLRSIDKDASRAIPYPLNTDLILNIVEDNFSASHPLGAIAVAPLAEAAGVYHTNPEMVYLPQQQGLGEYNDDYAGALYLFEERPDDELWQDADYFGRPEEIVSTFDMLEETREEHDERIDQHWTLRSRLFDLVIGDWDRHDDQWRWAKIERGENNYYRPIPRDRDQAFSNYDGLIFGVARRIAAKSRQWRPYSDNLGPVHWATYNAHLFDQSFLTAMSWSDWEEAIRHLQTTLTDEVIEEAFAQNWPEPFLSRDAPNIKVTLKGRRDKLRDFARDYYEFLAKEVDVLGTDQRDLFLIERLDDQRTRIRVFDTNKEGEQEDILYDRIFLNSETQQISCYGLEDDDIFQITGTVATGMKIHCLGGGGKDYFEDESVTTQAGKTIHIHDFKSEENTLVTGKDTRDRRSRHPANNLYDRRSSAYDYNFNLVLPILGYNPDDQLFVGITGVYTMYGFQRDPFASRHAFGAQASLTTGGVRAYYTGDYSNVFGRWGVQLAAEWQTPLYASNFYGLGNETENPEEELGLDFNRLRERRLSFAPRLSWHPNQALQFLIGPRFSSIRIDQTEGRFIDDIAGSLPDEIFEGVDLLSWEADFSYKSKDQAAFPTRGIDFRTKAGYTTQIDGDDFDFPYLDASLAVYQNLDSRGRLVFASRVGVEHRFTNDFPFFLGAQLGGLGPDGNLRGFRRDRFTGRTAYYHNTDLRWKLAFWNNRVAPMTVGLTGSFDYGRVWIDDADSNVWHYSYGGGFFLSPFDIITVHAGAYLGDGEEVRFLVGGKFFY